MYRCTFHHYHLLDHHHDHLHGHSHEHLDHLHGDDNSNLGVPIRLRRLNLVGRKLVTAINLRNHDHDGDVGDEDDDNNDDDEPALCCR